MRWPTPRDITVAEYGVTGTKSRAITFRLWLSILKKRVLGTFGQIVKE
jgi:hypothetical protein